MIESPVASGALEAGFVAIALALAVLFVVGTRLAGVRLRETPSTRRRWTWLAAVGVLAWLGATWAAAESGHLLRPDLALPPVAALLLSIVLLGVLIAFTPFGTRLVRGLPLAALVGVQAFRLPLELLMHRAYAEGVMPWQMSYSGWNFDILTGITAIPVAWLAHRRPDARRVVRLWNLMGALLLANIVGIAVASTPLFAAFGPDALNTWVLFPPFVWLPAVMVLTALAGHLLIARALRAPASNVHATPDAR
jgi:hypothetical protein